MYWLSGGITYECWITQKLYIYELTRSLAQGGPTDVSTFGIVRDGTTQFFMASFPEQLEAVGDHFKTD